jgi:DNA-binding IclR family transcriptional regulator
LRIAGFTPLPDWVLPALEKIRDEAEETTLLAKLSGVNAVYLEIFESAQSIRYIAQVDDLRPLYASAAGKSLLGAMSTEDREAVLARIPLVKRNANTIVTRTALYPARVVFDSWRIYCGRDCSGNSIHPGG